MRNSSYNQSSRLALQSISIPDTPGVQKGRREQDRVHNPYDLLISELKKAKQD